MFSKCDKRNIIFDINPFDTIQYKRLFENDKNILLDILGNRDFYSLIKGIAYEMNDMKEINIINIKKIINKNIERNFGGLEINADFENDLDELPELEIYKYKIYQNILEEISKRKKWISSQIFKKVYNIYCKYNEE